MSEGERECEGGGGGVRWTAPGGPHVGVVVHGEPRAGGEGEDAGREVRPVHHLRVLDRPAPLPLLPTPPRTRATRTLASLNQPLAPAPPTHTSTFTQSALLPSLTLAHTHTHTHTHTAPQTHSKSPRLPLPT
jgi:hypothetical protein